MPDEKRPYVKEAEVNRILDGMRFDIANGMTDAEASTITGLPVRTIQRWRLKNGLKKPKGFQARELAEVYAISTLGEALGDARHRTRRSVIDGRWEPPVFMVREHIDYDLFLRVVDTAHRVLGISENDLVKALGMSPRTIEQGLAIYTRHLNTATRRCLHCDSPIDPNVQAHYCTTICERMHGRAEQSS